MGGVGEASVLFISPQLESARVCDKLKIVLHTADPIAPCMTWQGSHR